MAITPILIGNTKFNVNTETGQVTTQGSNPVLVFTVNTTTGKVDTTPDTSTYFVGNQFRTAVTATKTKLNLENPSGSLPAPASPTGQTPAAADAGPNSGIGTQFTGVGIEPLPEGTFDSGKVGKFTYPSTLNSGQDRVFITQFKYRRSGAIQTEFDFRQTGEGAVTQPLGYVTLPMPNDLSEANSVGWGEDSLSNAAALMMGPLSQGIVGMAEGNMGQLTNAGELLGGVLNRGDVSARIKQVLTANAAASVVKKFGINVNPEAYISRITSAAVNPNLELLFNGPKLRQFSLAYKMVARSQAEAEQIRGILRFFKKGMAPQRSQSTSFYLGTPNVFRVEFKSGNTTLKSIGQFKTCALVAFSANYTPDGFYAAYDDSKAGGSQPIAVTMQMGFTELTPVFNDEYDDGKMDDVGPNKFDTDYNVLNLTGSTDGEGNNSAPGNEQRGVSGPPTPGTQTAGR
jgi:hypothetical protein